MRFDLSLYDDEFFKWHYDKVHQTEITTGREIAQHFKPKTLADFGCGIGSMLVGAKIEGVKVKGFEISEAAKAYTDKFVQDDITYMDCTTKMDVGKFDLVICTEVAEHIERKDSDKLVENICNASNRWVVFTAAPPGQEGTGHINCQDHAFWNYLFLVNGFEQISINTTLTAPDYIVKNLKFYERV